MAFAPAITRLFLKPAEPQGFPDFYREHERRVRATLYSLVPADDVDDLVQQVFLRCWTHRERFEGRAKESTWVTRITINCATDFWRQSKRKMTTGLDAIAELGDDAGRNAVGQVEARWVLDYALRDLSLEHRTVLVLHYLQDLALDEIALVLREPLGTVKSRLHYAKQHVRQRLEEAELKA